MGINSKDAASQNSPPILCAHRIVGRDEFALQSFFDISGMKFLLAHLHETYGLDRIGILALGKCSLDRADYKLLPSFGCCMLATSEPSASSLWQSTLFPAKLLSHDCKAESATMYHGRSSFLKARTKFASKQQVIGAYCTTSSSSIFVGFLSLLHSMHTVALSSHSFMPHSPCSLLSLPDELIIQIISRCRVEDVVHLGMTCRNLNLLCNARQIWMSLLQGLDIAQAPDVPSQKPVDALATEELRSKAIAAVRLYHNWQTPGALRVTQKAALHISPRVLLGLDNDADLPERVDPRVLPGGQHVLLENRGRLELWSLEPRARMWIAPCPREGILDCISFDFELGQDGNVLMVAAAFSDVMLGSTSLCVYQFDFRTWLGETVIERSLPLKFVIRVTVRGDFVMAHLPFELQIVLLNWRTASALVLDHRLSTGRWTNTRAALIASQYLIVALHLGALSLVAIPISSLDGRWSQDPRLSEWERITYPFTYASKSDPDPADSESEHVLRLRLADPPRDLDDNSWMLALHAFTPAWRKDSRGGDNVPTEIYVVASDIMQDKARRLLSYRVQLSRDVNSDAIPIDDISLRQVSNGAWRLALIAQTKAPASKLPWNPQSISNAGRMFSLQGNIYYCYTLFSDAPQPTNMVPLPPDIISEGMDTDPTVASIEPSRGAVAIGTTGLLRVIQLG